MPLAGGTMIASDHDRPKGGTVGLVLKSRRGAFLITAGHVVGAKGRSVFNVGTEVGKVLFNRFTGRNEDQSVQQPDIAIVKIGTDFEDYEPMIIRATHGRGEVSLPIHALWDDDDLPAKASVTFAGSVTGIHNAKLAQHTTLEVKDGRRKHYEVDVVTMTGAGATQPGDSGAAVCLTYRRQNYVIGIYAGKIRATGGGSTHYFVPVRQFAQDVEAAKLL